MTQQTSIWRWITTDDLNALFARLVQADDETFNAVATEMAGQYAEDIPDVQETYAKTEAKFRAMNLPADVLETMLAGLREMMEEALQAEDELDDEDGDDDWDDDGGPDGEGRAGVALATSHMFFDDPYASLEYEEIDAQIENAITQYSAAISKAVGNDGQTLAAYLGVDEETLYDEDAYETLMKAGFDEAVRVWVSGDAVVYLTNHQEDKELPIDLEFIRAPLAALDALKGQI